MLPEVGGLEYLVIAAVALIVVGPKDLPMMLRKLGQFVGKLRGMAAEFRASFDEMARQSELDDLRKEVEAMRKGQFADQAAQDATNVEVNQIFSEIGDSLGDSGMQFSPAMARQIEPMTMEAAPVVEPPPARAPRARKPRLPKKDPPDLIAPGRTKASAAKASAPKTARKAAAKPAVQSPTAKAPAKRQRKPKAGTAS